MRNKKIIKGEVYDMKRRIATYSAIWAICLAIFNVITFVTPNEINGVSKFNATFWVGYIFITVAFVGQLVCSLMALKEKRARKLFYKLPMAFISYSGLIAMLVAGGIVMLINAIPEWIGIIACAIILAVNAIAVIKANSAANTVSDIEEKIKNQTFFMKNLTAEAQTLMNSASSDKLKAEAKRVYESVRYANPNSYASLDELNLRIEREFSEFSNAITDGDAALAKAIANTLVSLIDKRNNECKLIKSRQS
jgi:hypothetical protein